MAKPEYVYPKSKRWPIRDKQHAELAATYLLAGRGKPSDWPRVFRALDTHWGKSKEVRLLLDRYLRQGPPPSKRSAPNPMAKRSKSNPDPMCAVPYDDFRAYGPDYEATYWELRGEHDERIKKHNDYSQPPRHAAILGRMHQYKFEAWQELQGHCDRENPLSPGERARGKSPRVIRIGGRLAGHDGPWEPLRGAPVALTQRDGLWTLTHTPSGTGLRSFKTKAKAKAHFKRAQKAVRLTAKDWKFPTWKTTTKTQRAKVRRWIEA